MSDALVLAILAIACFAGAGVFVYMNKIAHYGSIHVWVSFLGLYALLGTGIFCVAAVLSELW